MARLMGRLKLSLSARRAWIEITRYISSQRSRRSLSARRAWIEILQSPTKNRYNHVALRKESVDRNCGLDWGLARHAPSLSARRAWIEMASDPAVPVARRSRSPQGERG